MRISLNWLRELVDITLSPEELAQMLTLAGFEVEDIEDRRTWADGVVVGKIIDCQPHPNADKLRVCQVDVGASGDPLNIVCGAPNARVDLYVPVATIGTYLPTIDLKIKPAKLRGVPSQGMICSLAELGLAKESAGIHIFAEGLKLGSDVRPLLGLDDVILDLTATANRADALSMVGIAREVAALTGTSLRLPAAGSQEIGGTAANSAARFSMDTSLQGCPIYIGTVIEGVKIAPSPEWLQRRLQAAGVRPINNVVDVTNYILQEWGQPLHAFDRERLQAVAGSEDLTIGVRFAKTGETLKTLDGQARTLQEQNLLITANDKPVALAGIMGGEETEVHDGTQNLILEAAIFEPVAIRRSARSQGLRTEASTRYERGVNQAELATACQRAVQLLAELAQGVPVAQETAGSQADRSVFTRSIELRLDRVNQLLGAIKQGDATGELQPAEMERTLTALGCSVTPTEQERVWKVTVPAYRYRDLEREIDLIEEIARLYGYNNFCETLPSKTAAGVLPVEQKLNRQVRAAFRGAGLTELMHYSLVRTEGDNQVVLSNPLFVEYSALRTEMLSGLIDAFQYNLEQGNGPLNGFEIGRIFWKEGDALKETDAIAGIIGGDPTEGRWARSGREQPLSWFEAKGLLESVFERLNLAVECKADSSDERLHPGRTASLWLRGSRLGTFGQLHPQLRQERGLPDEVYLFQLDWGVLLASLSHEAIARRFRPYSTFPAAGRDIAFFAPANVSVAEIEGAIAKAAGGLLESVELFDEYRGENVPAGQRSLALRLIYRGSDRTLTDEDVEPVQQKVRDALVKNFSVSLRS
ncbi:phenylalanine--tRNA ligase subunit beta [Microcoleus sp. FACHB-672]|uniref:phenylalanine--tRNA ligase subunit beta n=1 Tax=Microcoleus sp. FACHB-672 TaxID=2692825 RepID=UPI0016824EFC|nr:phenylalanine--tRNA ligase subunit beta [Microcoleus sp. FACHB-672]MBD2041045.1 phenylalanine--tRNA ligase subunit beta [Microcoleus sp. FACHB-672]